MANPITDDLLDLMPHEVQVHPRTFDGWGEGTDVPGASYAMTAYVYGAAQKVQNSRGITVDSKYTIVTGGYFGVRENDRLVLPSGFEVVSGECVAVNEHSDENGAHHQTIYL